jgi:cytochrome bd-type quinol oxidase subunit 2
MIDPITSAYVFSVLTAIVAVFQLALALGAPWGEMAMGGKFPGRFPPQMRIAALVQILLYFFLAFVVLTRAGLVFGEYFELSTVVIWFVVALFVVGTILNIITPSKKERMLWAPVSAALLVCSIIVAMS